MCWNVGLNDLQFPQNVEDTMKPSAKKRLQDMHDLIIEEQPHIMFFQTTDKITISVAQLVFIQVLRLSLSSEPSSFVRRNILWHTLKISYHVSHIARWLLLIYFRPHKPPSRHPCHCAPVTN